MERCPGFSGSRGRAGVVFGAVAALALVGCMRPIGTIWDDDEWDACCGFDSSPGDAGPDAGPMPDAGCAGPLCGDCHMGPQVFLEGETEPHFTYDVELVSGHRALVTGAEGWNSPSNLAVWLIGPLPDLVVADKVTMQGDWLAAGAEPGSDRVALLRHKEDWSTDLTWAILSESGIQTGAVIDICADCFPTRTGPVVRGSRAAFSVEHRDDSALDVGITGPGGTVTWVTSDTGTQPVLVSLGDRVVVSYLQNGNAVTQMFDWEGNLLVPPTPAGVQGPLTGDLYLSERDGHAVLWAFRYEDPLGTLVQVDLDDNAMASNITEFPSVSQFPMGLRVCSDSGSNLVVWGEMSGPCGVGVHGLWVLRAGPDLHDEVLTGPGLISDPIRQAAATYTIWPACLFDRSVGFVFWGGWQEDTYYGLYARSVHVLEAL